MTVGASPASWGRLRSHARATVLLTTLGQQHQDGARELPGLRAVRLPGSWCTDSHCVGQHLQAWVVESNPPCSTPLKENHEEGSGGSVSLQLPQTRQWLPMGGPGTSPSMSAAAFAAVPL